MKNIQDLRNALIQNFNDLKIGAVDLAIGAEMNNTAGKIIATAVLELKYHELKGVDGPIEFLEYDSAQIEHRGVTIDHKE